MAANWGEITVQEILTPTKGTWVKGKQQTILQGLSTDSRNIRPGELFWALKGEQFDGHDFVKDAIDQGAAGAVVQNDRKFEIPRAGDHVIISVPDALRALGDLAGWWRRWHTIQVVAITGSAGKTTTKEMVATILKLGRITLKSQGNFNNLIGLPLTLLQLEKRHQGAVLEMGMNCPGEIARLTEIANPDVGVITNIGMAHLEGVGDLEGVARAKVELVEKLSSRSKAVLNGDDKRLMKTASVFRKDAVLFGLGKKNDVRAHGIRNMGRDGMAFDIQYEGDSWPVKVRVPGLQNVLNSLAAAAACLCLNVPPEHIVEGLSRFEGLKGRFRVITLPGDVTLVDDTYNANPSSLKAALQSVKSLIDEGSRLIVGLGEMLELGDATVAAHQQAGQWLAEFGAYHFLAMGEHAYEMREGARKAGMSHERAEVVSTHAEMVKRIREEMRKGDLIFLKGSRKMTLEKVIEGLRGNKPLAGDCDDHPEKKSIGGG